MDKPRASKTSSKRRRSSKKSSSVEPPPKRSRKAPACALCQALRDACPDALREEGGHVREADPTHKRFVDPTRPGLIWKTLCEAPVVVVARSGTTTCPWVGAVIRTRTGTIAAPGSEFQSGRGFYEALTTHACCFVPYAGTGEWGALADFDVVAVPCPEGLAWYEEMFAFLCGGLYARTLQQRRGRYREILKWSQRPNAESTETHTAALAFSDATASSETQRVPLGAFCARAPDGRPYLYVGAVDSEATVSVFDAPWRPAGSNSEAWLEYSPLCYGRIVSRVELTTLVSIPGFVCGPITACRLAGVPPVNPLSRGFLRRLGFAFSMHAHGVFPAVSNGQGNASGCLAAGGVRKITYTELNDAWLFERFRSGRPFTSPSLTDLCACALDVELLANRSPQLQPEAVTCTWSLAEDRVRFELISGGRRVRYYYDGATDQPSLTPPAWTCGDNSRKPVLLWFDKSRNPRATSPERVGALRRHSRLVDRYFDLLHRREGFDSRVPLLSGEGPTAHPRVLFEAIAHERSDVSFREERFADVPADVAGLWALEGRRGSQPRENSQTWQTRRVYVLACPSAAIRGGYALLGVDYDCDRPRKPVAVVRLTAWLEGIDGSYEKHALDTTKANELLRHAIRVLYAGDS